MRNARETHWMCTKNFTYEAKKMDEQKTARLTFRVTEDEREIIQNASGEASMSFSEYIRSKVFTPEEAWRRDKKTKEFMQSLLYEINRIGNNINQLARAANAKGFASRQDIQNVIGHLRDVEKKTGEILDRLKK